MRMMLGEGRADLAFVRQLERLRPKLAKAAQEVYDAWEQDEDGVDMEYGTGGICDDIAEEMCSVLNDASVDCFTLFNESEEHTSAWAYDIETRSIVILYLPANVYETGGGYTWKKIPDVKFRPNDIEIIDMSMDWDQYIDEETGEVIEY